MDPGAIGLTLAAALIKTLISMAFTTLLQEWAKRVGLGKEFITLKKELTRINSTLETAQGLRTKNNALLMLLKDLQQLAYETDDLLDELDYYRIEDDIELCGGRNSSSSQISGSNGSSSSSSSGFKLASRGILSAFRKGCCSTTGVVKQLRSSFPNRITMSRRMNELVTQLRENGASVREALNLEAAVTNAVNNKENQKNEATETNPRETTSRMPERVFGRHEEKDNLINLIVGEEASKRTLSVVAIVGHGGVGKTTLARSVYNDELKLKPQFDLQMWVTVSVNFDVKRLTREFLQIASDSDHKSIQNFDKLQTILEECLETKRFLLVLDDMWEDDKANDWNVLLAPLKNSSKKGNVVLVTTRRPGIKKMDRTIELLSLDGLEENVYWSLFKAHAFDDEMHEGHQNLQNIGCDIVSKMKGNPLAAKTVGALLRKDLGERHWRIVLEREEWKHDDGVDSIMPALRISYEYLPFHLQRCFSYCALFPKDFEFPQEFLVQLWLAQSFIQAENMRLEDVGKKNLDNLVDFGFLQRNDEEDGRPVYAMHDLLHDLAQNVTSEECLSNLDGGEIQQIPPTTRHLSIGTFFKSGTEDDISISGDLEKNLIKVENHLKAGKLSTLIVDGDENVQRTEGFLERLKIANSLRVLVLTGIPNAPTLFSISINFTHLRYLCLSSDDTTLPGEICRLYHLQVLNLCCYYYLEELPIEFNNLINLRHFEVHRDKKNLHPLIAGVGKLANLQELHKFRVRKEKEFAIEQLRGLKELGGQLCISNLENVESTMQARSAGLIEKSFLDGLHLSWDRENSDVGHAADAAVLEGLKPHPNLKKLKITRYGGATFSTWLNSLTYLEKVHLEDFVACEILPPLGQLPFLKRLYLTSMSSLIEIGPDLYGCGQHVPFQCLEEMKLVDLPNLAKWVWHDRCQMLSALRELLILNCPKLEFSVPSCVPPADFNARFPNLDKLTIVDCAEVVQLPSLPSNQKAAVHKINVATFNIFKLSASQLIICKPSNPKAWDEIYHNMRTRTITELEISSSPYPLSWDNLMNLACLKKLTMDDCTVPFSLSNPLNQSCPLLMSLNSLCITNSGITGKLLTWVLHHVPMLSVLELENCKEIKSIGVATKTSSPAIVPEKDEGLLQIPILLNYLQYLRVCDMPDLVFASERGLSGLVSLRRLKVCPCSRLLYPLEFGQPIRKVSLLPPGLKLLSLSGASEQASLLLKGLCSLTGLKIADSPELKSLDVTSCVALESLYLHHCKKLSSLNGRNSLAHLKHLDVFNCPGFVDGWISASEIGFSMALVLLTIDTFEILAIPICGQLTSLQQLIIHGEDAVCMTEEQEEVLLLLTSLKVIEFSYCRNLRNLPPKLHLLHYLERLHIFSCPNIQSPPENGLPESLRRLKVTICGAEVTKLFAEYECGPLVKKELW